MLIALGAGTTKTFMENLMPTTAGARIEAQHVFLQMRQPVDESIMPQPRVLESGRTNRYPFTFVVPAQLLPHVCKHACDSEQVHAAHLRLPPSLGDSPASAGGVDKAAALDDLAPDMSKIAYSIRARLTRSRERDGAAVVAVGEGRRQVQIVPAMDEDPPLQVVGDDGDAGAGRRSRGVASQAPALYRLRKHKDLKKGLVKGRLGTLSVEAAQPKALELAPPGCTSSGRADTMVTVLPRFDPADQAAAATSPPPRLSELASRLKVYTYFSTTPTNGFPDSSHDRMGSPGSTQQLYRRSFFETLPLSSRCVEAARWERHDNDDSSHSTARAENPLGHGISSVSSSTVPRATPSYRGGVFFTATILVPVSLPAHKAFVPTFHSCLVSRVYVLEISLGAHAPGPARGSAGGSSGILRGGSGGIALTLRIPVQIAARGRSVAVAIATDVEDPPRISRGFRAGGSGDDDNAQADPDVDAELDAMFKPRLVSPPAEALSDPATYGLPQRGPRPTSSSSSSS